LTVGAHTGREVDIVEIVSFGGVPRFPFGRVAPGQGSVREYALVRALRQALGRGKRGN